MFDRENMFSDKQALTATAASTDVVYVGEGDAGPGQPLFIEIDATPSTGVTAMTVTVNTSDAEAMTGAVVLGTFTVSTDRLAAGGPILIAAIPSGCKRFLRLNYTITGTPSNLTVTAGLVAAGQSNLIPQKP